LGEISARGIPIDAHLSPGHVQVLIALGRGPHSIRQLAGVVGSSPLVAVGRGVEGLPQPLTVRLFLHCRLRRSAAPTTDPGGVPTALHVDRDADAEALRDVAVGQHVPDAADRQRATRP